MTLRIKTLVAVAACTVFATGAFAQSPVVPVENEPPPRLIVERLAYEQLVRTFKQVDYAKYMAARPQTLYGIADSPVGLGGLASRSQ